MKKIKEIMIGTSIFWLPIVGVYMAKILIWFLLNRLKI